MDKQEPERGTETILVRWKTPDEGWHKLNTDGSSEGNLGRAGAGGVIRDHNGAWIRGFSRKLGWTTSISAELWGLREGLVMARMLNLDSIHIEVDAIAICDMITGDRDDYLALKPIITDCKKLMETFRRCRIRHTYREGNSVADALARRGVLQEPILCYFDVPPNNIRDVVFRDFSGTAMPRMKAITRM